MFKFFKVEIDYFNAKLERITNINRSLALISIHHPGALYFSSALKMDSQPGMLYKCNVFNSLLDITIGGSYANVTITDGMLLG